MNKIPDSIDGYVFHNEPKAFEIHRCVKLWRDFPGILLSLLFRRPVPPVVTVTIGKPRNHRDIPLEQISDLLVQPTVNNLSWEAYFVSSSGAPLGKRLEFSCVETAEEFKAEVDRQLRNLKNGVT